MWANRARTGMNIPATLYTPAEVHKPGKEVRSSCVDFTV